MSLKPIFFKSIFALCVVLVLLVGFVIQTAQAASATPVLTLTVETLEGESVSNLKNGEPVIIRWFIDGPVKNCSITGVGPIDTSVLPVSGNTQLYPPNNTQVNYKLNCDALVEEVVVNNNPPVVNISIRQGTTLQVDNLTGYVDKVHVDWDSQNADRCSLVSREASSNPGLRITETSTAYDYWGEYTKSGTVLYDGWPRRITEDTTFYITCYNDQIGAEDTASVKLFVTNPPPPDPILVNVWTPDSDKKVGIGNYGYAIADVRFNSANATRCYQSVTDDSGISYSNPYGYGTHSSYLSRNFTNVRIFETTIFNVTCTRGAVTIGGIVYPATSTTDTLRIETVLPEGVLSLDTWDRSTLPAVTISATATPETIVKNSVSGLATTQIELHTQNASNCQNRAYYMDGRGYNLTGWTKNYSNWGPGVWGNISLSTTTKLTIYCYRSFDLNRTQAEIDNGTARHEVVINVNPAPAEAPDPELYMYANPARFSTDYMWNNATIRTGFNSRGGTPRFMENSSQATTSSSITFPFAHPDGAGKSGTYNIHLLMCDENDGESTFKLYKNGSLLGQHTTDKVAPLNGSAGCNRTSMISKKIASSIDVNDGDVITVECTSPGTDTGDWEFCRFSEVLMGDSTGAVYVSPEVNPAVSQVTVPILWLSENYTNCGGTGYSHLAIPVDGPSYDWWGPRVFYTGGIKNGLIETTLSTSTNFTLGCYRTSDNKNEIGTVSVYVPRRATLSAEAIVAVGDCIDPNTLINGEAPPGYVADENGFCVPGIDLGAVPSSITPSGNSSDVDNVSGTYDNVRARLLIENVLNSSVGPIDLPSGENVSYKAYLITDPVINSVYGPVADIHSPISTYNSGITSTDVTSSALSSVLNGVMFGDNHQVCVRVNLDGSPNYPETASYLGNNEVCINASLPVPPPPMGINASDPNSNTTSGSNSNFIRTGEDVKIDWDVNVNYNLQCSVVGAGGLNKTFNTNTTGPAYSDSFTVVALEYSSIFTLTCTEPITNTTFIEETVVEVIPDYEER